ncbi:MAG: hypothetical protein ACI4XM_01450 [Candidatus Coprovivens sp.]
MVDVVFKDDTKIQEMKDYLSKSSTHFGGSKFTKMLKGFNAEEVFELFSDDILKKLEVVTDYDAMASVFRAVPAEVQEKIWFNKNIQKILLGLGTTSDQELNEIIINKKFFSMQDLAKKSKQGKFYYNPVKLRALEVLLRYIKSQNIKEQLYYNQYFYMILLCSKKVPDSFYTMFDVEKLFNEVIKSNIYRLADSHSKCLWLQQINNNCSKLLLSPDAKNLFLPSTSFSTWFYGDDKKTLASMLHSKLYSLSNKKMKINFTIESLKLLNLQELNVLKSDTNGVVDQKLIYDLLGDLIEDSFKDGTIFSKKYLDTSHLDVPIQRSLFKIVIDKSIGNTLYEDQMLEYLYGVLFNTEFSSLEKRALLISLKNALVYATEDTICDLFSYPNDLKSVFFLRFNLTARNMDYLYGIDVRQLMKINVKHINKIVQLLYDPEQDELSDSYSKAIKMYLVFGLERSIELLSGKYPINKVFLDNVSKLNVSKVEMKAEGKKYLPVYHEDFNRFMFAANNIDSLFDEDTAIHSSWYYLYNNFDMIKDLCKGHVNLIQAETILKEQVNTVRYDLEPDCYRLEKILYEAGLGNKTHYSNEEVYDEMCTIHRKQVRRTVCSIPYVKGILSSDWGYEVMRHESAIAFVLGYRAGCCIRTKDIAHNHLLHALLCENGRILLTYKPDGTIASFSPLKRNGEVLIANSIEAIDKEDSSIVPMTEAFKVGIEEICKVSKITEKNACIKVATIGSSSSRKPDGEFWPSTVPTPTIYEKKDSLYSNTDCYHKKLFIIYEDGDVNLRGLRYGEVKQKYLDPRKEIMACLYDSENVLLQRKAQRIIDSIRYTKFLDEGKNKEFFEKTRLGYYDAIFFNEDWYVIVDYCGLHYDCLDDDPRARKEMDATIEVINQYGKNRQEVRKLALQYCEIKNK